MPVTITRQHLLRLGEEAISMSIASSTSIEADALRKVLATTKAVARGTNRLDDVGCPMIQARINLDADGSEKACDLAICWDRVTGRDGLKDICIIHVNPYT